MTVGVDRNSQSCGSGPQTTEHAPTGEPSAAGAKDPDQSESKDPDTLQRLLNQIRELEEYFSYYVTAKTDSIKLNLRMTLVAIALAPLGFVFVAGVILMASWLVLNGIAGGLAELFGERSWLGSITAGMLVLAGLGCGIYFAIGKYARTARDRTVDKYEKRQAQQQARFGRSVSDDTAISSPEK